MVGPFPPPVHGLSTTNAEVHKSLVALGADVLVLNTSAPSLDRSPVARLGRLPHVLRGLRPLLGKQGFQGKTLYLSISGGFGQVYEHCLSSAGSATPHENFLAPLQLRLSG